VAASLPELLEDLENEYADLCRLVGPLAADASEWDRATPAEGWAVRDQISHLAYFDDAGGMALEEPDAFTEMAEQALKASGDPMEAHLARGRSMDGDELMSWWDSAHRKMARALTHADPASRVPWYGPPMGVPSFASARLMETWAHGQDVADALGCARKPTDRLRHVAHLGVRARPFSYAVRGMEVPDAHIEVVLTSPIGEPWLWEIGGADAVGHSGSVIGPALDFCLVVTQRRHVADTDIVATGTSAIEWISIAQAFAGPPGPGRSSRIERGGDRPG